MEPCDLSATEALRLMASGELSSRQLTLSCIDRIRRVNPAVNAVVAMDTDAALYRASQADQQRRTATVGLPLLGLPIGIKDLEDTAGLMTTYGSPLFSGYVPEQDQMSVARLRAAGGVILAKTNTPEFGAGGNTRNAVYGATGNPFAPNYSAAGSSGGSGAALATGMVTLASGSDMGGSLRNPAAFNGIVGFRPSPGVIPNERRVLGWSHLSTVGPMARSVEDVVLMLSVMACLDLRDPFSPTSSGCVDRHLENFHVLPTVQLREQRVAISDDLGFAPTEAMIRKNFEEKCARLVPLFKHVSHASPDCTGTDDVFEVLRGLNLLASFGEREMVSPASYGPNVRANLAQARGYSAQEIANAMGHQTVIYRRWQTFFKDFDFILTPAVTISPRPWTELYPAFIDGTPTRSYFHWLALAYAVTVVGHPALSLPLGLDSNGMPFGLQIVGARGGDAKLLAFAMALEKELSSIPDLRRPVPDIEKLSASSALSSHPNFLGFS